MQSPEATLASLPAATVYEAAGKTGEMAANIRPVVPGLTMAGPAYTVRCIAGQSLAVLRAIEAAPAGSVLVIDAGETDRSTIWGGTSTLAAKLRELAGCVTNASTRDVADIRALEFPVFAAGICLRGTLKNHPGWQGISVSVGGAVVEPGDFILGDDDGVVVVPRARIAEVAKASLAQRDLELDRERRQRDGEPVTEVLGLPPL